MLRGSKPERMIKRGQPFFAAWKKYGQGADQQATEYTTAYFALCRAGAELAVIKPVLKVLRQRLFVLAFLNGEVTK